MLNINDLQVCFNCLQNQFHRQNEGVGYKIEQLGELPVKSGVTLYIFVIDDGDFQGRYFEELERYWADIAQKSGERGGIVKGSARGFPDEVIRLYLGKNIEDIRKSLPALLITDAHPTEITKRTLRCFIPLERGEQSYGDLGTFFWELAEFTRHRSPVFLNRFKEKRTWRDWLNAIGGAIEIKPGFWGVSFNVIAFIRRLT